MHSKWKQKNLRRLFSDWKWAHFCIAIGNKYIFVKEDFNKIFIFGWTQEFNFKCRLSNAREPLYYSNIGNNWIQIL